MAARYQHFSPAFLADVVNLLDLAFREPDIASGGEQDQAPLLPTAWPQFTGSEIYQLGCWFFGSVIGDRTRTLRLERAAC
jgi:hypothetical protein